MRWITGGFPERRGRHDVYFLSSNRFFISEEAIDVCLAIEQMNEEAAQKERISTLFANIKNLREKMGWSAEQSMDVLNVSDSDRKALWQLLK